MFSSELTHENLPEHINRLESMKTYIEQLDKTSHLEILKILKKNPKIKLNENKSGVYVNLSFLGEDIIQEMMKYVDYMKSQETTINEVEQYKKYLLETTLSDKDIKDNGTTNITTTSTSQFAASSFDC